MDQIHHIRLSGHTEAIPLSAPASSRLLGYLADARTALGSTPNAEETLRDRETEIGSRLLRIIAALGGPVTDIQMATLLSDIGPVDGQRLASGAPASAPRGPFWARIDEGKWFGGICLGIAVRGDFDVAWVRTVVFFAMLFTGGFLIAVYLVALLFLPRIESVEEYRRLRDGTAAPTA